MSAWYLSYYEKVKSRDYLPIPSVFLAIMFNWFRQVVYAIHHQLNDIDDVSTAAKYALPQKWQILQKKILESSD